ncbi:uncharacterized protein TrAtP1_011997 [Trichoderma atroviride]|uniref:uncharacterized protein n=1 Tax=Hypocrea atroviridis TaxID=63577 RepID=UPI0033179A9E|nr:hypothetical protein TrAtP1_011997 [Trichoderma atroviride]
MNGDGKAVLGRPTLYIADPNGDGLVEGGEIVSGVPHVNLKTLRSPDINGDGRAGYVYIGEGDAFKRYMNVGSVGGQDVIFYAQGGIATGAVDDMSRLVFANINGDGKDGTPLIWDDDGDLIGFLNQRVNCEGVPLYIHQVPAKTIAHSIHHRPSSIRLAGVDGDGKDDYVSIGDHGALNVW